jgi:hypothetical protein
MPIPAIAYAAAYIGGNLGGIALGTAIVRKVLPSKSSAGYGCSVSSKTQIEMLGFDMSTLYK